MTFDDGIFTIYTTVNIGEPGSKPVVGLVKKENYYYNYDTLGVTRYYKAMQAQQQLEAVVDIPEWNDISTLDICILENQKQYKIAMIQNTYDDDGLKITRLSLERLGEKYDIKN